MKCPKCGAQVIYEDLIDEYYDSESHSEKWLVVCPGYECDFEGKLWQDYQLIREEWDNEEDNN